MGMGRKNINSLQNAPEAYRRKRRCHGRDINLKAHPSIPNFICNAEPPTCTFSDNKSSEELIVEATISMTLLLFTWALGGHLLTKHLKIDENIYNGTSPHSCQNGYCRKEKHKHKIIIRLEDVMQERESLHLC